MGGGALRAAPRGAPQGQELGRAEGRGALPRGTARPLTGDFRLQRTSKILPSDLLAASERAAQFALQGPISVIRFSLKLNIFFAIVFRFSGVAVEQVECAGGGVMSS